MTNPLTESPIATQNKPGAEGFDEHARKVLIENTAQTAYNVIKVYAEHIGDRSFKPWAETTEAIRAGYRKGVIGILDHDHSPEDSHKSWLTTKASEGWTYGPLKDEEKKQHPCMVPYPQLPVHHRMKDTIFGSVVRGYVSVKSLHLPEKI